MNKTTFYTTIENQMRTDGSRGLLYDHFDNPADAEAKYFTICAAAAKSEIPYHAAMLIQDTGAVLMWRVYDRRVEEETETETTAE